jgi:hypothetical protein
MIRNIAAVLAAAISAGLIVTFVPGIGSEVEARTQQATDQGVVSTAAGPARKAIEQAPAAVIDAVKPGCTRAWPYYEQGCLRGASENHVKARVVRVIALDRQPAARAGQARR